MTARPRPGVRDAACARAGIERCSPNDLRRTCATWLRAAGVAPDLIAPVMGHADTRMVERVYGRLSPQALATRLAAALGPNFCDTFVPDTLKTGGSTALPGLEPRTQPAELKGPEVPRDGIEPPTRGFSIPFSTD